MQLVLDGYVENVRPVSVPLGTGADLYVRVYCGVDYWDVLVEIDGVYVDVLEATRSPKGHVCHYVLADYGTLTVPVAGARRTKPRLERRPIVTDA